MENKKTLVNYVLILSGILVILLLGIFTLSSRFKSSDKSNQSQSVYPTPTPYPLNSINKKLSPSLTPTPSPIPAFEFTGVKEVEFDPKIAAPINQSFELKKRLPLKRGSLKIDFDYEKDVFVISPITDQTEISNKEKEEFLNWLKENYPDLDQEKIIYSPTPFISPPPKKINFNITPVVITPFSTPEASENSLSTLVDLIKILYNFSFSQTNYNSIISPPSSLTLTPYQNQTGAGPAQINYTPPQTQYPYIYYPQLNGPFDNYPLGGGCTIRKAGCGPTTVAMIVASYKDRSVNPITIVNQYGSRAGCGGSSYSDAMEVLRSYGIKVGSLIIYNNNGINAEGVAPVFKQYINAGKTIFALANFRSDGGGHFFWVIDVDEKNNLWAFDPYYGRYQIPYNENSRYPYPLYRLAFPVSP